MTTEETEKKFAKNAGIHCPTLELAKKVLDIFHKLGLKWCNGIAYIKCTDWDKYKENTIYYPLNGTLSSLKYAQQNDYKIISAEKFIALHTEDFDLETYEPKGELKGFPKEIISRMLDYQQEQGNKRDVSVFEKCRSVGFVWNETKEKGCFWNEVISNKDFDLFFKRYPKKEDSQVFRVGDEVIDIITGRKGKVIGINTLNKDTSIFVDFGEHDTAGFTLDGRYHSTDKYPRLLHYRKDYDYSVIDFNNLPQRQEVKRYRAEVGEKYYYFNTYFEVDSFIEEYHNIDTKLYNLGDYFQTKEQAQEVADKLKEYFEQLIQEN